MQLPLNLDLNDEECLPTTESNPVPAPHECTEQCTCILQ